MKALKIILCILFVILLVGLSPYIFIWGYWTIPSLFKVISVEGKVIDEQGNLLDDVSLSVNLSYQGHWGKQSYPPHLTSSTRLRKKMDGNFKFTFWKPSSVQIDFRRKGFYLESLT